MIVSLRSKETIEKENEAKRKEHKKEASRRG